MIIRCSSVQIRILDMGWGIGMGVGAINGVVGKRGSALGWKLVDGLGNVSLETGPSEWTGKVGKLESGRERMQRRKTEVSGLEGSDNRVEILAEQGWRGGGAGGSRVKRTRETETKQWEVLIKL